MTDKPIVTTFGMLAGQLDAEVKKVMKAEGMNYMEAFGVVREERPELIRGYQRTRHSDRRERQQIQLSRFRAALREGK